MGEVQFLFYKGMSPTDLFWAHEDWSHDVYGSKAVIIQENVQIIFFSSQVYESSKKPQG